MHVKIIAAIIFCALLSSCDKTSMAATARGTANVREVAKDLDRHPSTQPHAAILGDNAELIDYANKITPDARAELQQGGYSVAPTVSAERLAADPDAEAQKSAKDLEDGKQELDDARERGWTWWILGAAGGLLALARVASRFFPGVSPFVEMATGAVSWLGGGRTVKQVEQRAKAVEAKASALTELVAGSHVAHQGLRKLDERFPELREKILEATNGKADTIEGAFTYLAKSYADDRGTHDQADRELKQIRDAMPTEGGIPKVLLSLLK